LNDLFCFNIYLTIKTYAGKSKQHKCKNNFHKKYLIQLKNISGSSLTVMREKEHC